MSTIALTFDRRGGPASASTVAAMLDAARAPDGHRVVVDGPCGLGHGLLVTVPEDAPGALPLRHASRAISITCDARVDNRAELAPSLDLAPDAADAAFLLAAYARWGRAFPGKIIGDFAFAIWDADQHAVFIGRDPMGVRLLYFTDRDDRFACASNKRALLSLDGVRRAIDETAFAMALLDQFHERDRTLLADVSAVPPAHALWITRAGVSRQRTWAPDPFAQAPRASDEEHAAELRRRLEAAVGARLRANRPVTVALSGGLDSTSVAALARAAAPNRIHAIRLTFPGLAGDETAYAAAAAQHLDLAVHHVFPLAEREAHRPRLEDATLDRMWYAQLRSQELLLQRGAERFGARVHLTGIGGDQLMHESPGDADVRLRSADVRGFLKSAGGAPGVARFFARGAVRAVIPLRLRVERHARMSAGPFYGAIPARLRALALDELTRIASEIDDIPAPDATQHHFASELTDGYNTAWVLARHAPAAAHLGADFRHPFLDVRVLEHLLAIPHHLRDRDGFSKPVLRCAMRGALPDVVLQRTDPMGFGDYIRRGTFEPFADDVQRWLVDGTLVREGLLDGTRLQKWVGSTGFGWRYFRYACMTLALELWLRQLLSPAGKS